MVDRGFFSESGETGRRARLRILYRKVWGFDSPLSQLAAGMKGNGKQGRPRLPTRIFASELVAGPVRDRCRVLEKASVGHNCCMPNQPDR